MGNQRRWTRHERRFSRRRKSKTKIKTKIKIKIKIKIQINTKRIRVLPPHKQRPHRLPLRKKPEVKITPREAEQLFHSVDEILTFDSKQTGLPIKKQVKRRLTSRDEVEGYLTKHMKDEDVKRLQRSELVLKKFGLLPRDFDLEKLWYCCCANRSPDTTIPKRRP